MPLNAREPDAGELDKRVTLLAWQVKRSPLGQETGTWSEVATVWAKVVDQNGTEQVEAQETIATLNCLITIRYRPGVCPQMRLMYRGRPLGIASVADLGRKRFLLLSCVKAA